MALKPTYGVIPQKSKVNWYFNNSTVVSAHGGTVQRGGIASFDSANGSGVALDQADNKVTYVATALSGIVPVGVMVNDVKNLDLTVQELNPYKYEVQNGGKVEIWETCEVTTNWIYPGHTPTIGGRAYVGHSGYFAASNVATDHSDTTGSQKIVGRFLSKKDQDGYCTIAVVLPNNN